MTASKAEFPGSGPGPIPEDGAAALAARFAAVHRRIAIACADSGRDPADVTLIAVTKTVPVTAIEAAIALGQRVFGENRVQEAADKFPELRARKPEISLHHIGPLQTNKLNSALGLFQCLQSLDRPAYAEALARKRDAGAVLPSLFVQINIGEEPQKAGVLPVDADTFLDQCAKSWQLPVIGLMCIPPAERPPAPYFALTRAIANRNGLAQLSMGMSGDFEAAIALGATHIRLGSVLFGQRPPALSA